MTLSFANFLGDLSNPAYAIVVFLTLGVIFVNGWTDAPNAIATCVSTRAIGVKQAILLGSVCNFLGVTIMTMFNSKVAETIFHMVDFNGNSQDSLQALCAAMIAIVVWALTAWKFGIPTSESHALIAGLSGAAIAIQNSFAGINMDQWVKVLYGLAVSTICGFTMGFILAKLIAFVCKGMTRSKTEKFFQGSQILGGSTLSFLHGAQDGQKFMSVIMLAVFLSNGQSTSQGFKIPIWLMILCSLTMTLGTAIGGYKIIKNVGSNMVKLRKYQGFAADMGTTITLFISTIIGMPVSTSQSTTSSIMGVGAARRISCVNWSIVKNMIMTWLLTFPCCGLIGYILAKIFTFIFN